MSADYWLGVATIPAIALVLFIAFVSWVRAGMWLEARGITFEAKVRDTGKISDWTMRRDIWWERQFGPIFVGHWYREFALDRPRVNRWIGLGSANGPCLMAFHSRDLEATEAP